jgi:hypothetical protein
MNINGRLLLLAVVIGLFARVWTVNDRSGVRPVTRHTVVVTRAVEPPARAIAVAATVAATAVSDRQPVETVANGEERWTTSDAPIALPRGLAGGTYRVVNDAGRVAILTVTEAAVDESPAARARSEMFVLTVGQDRWYVIRLRGTPGPLPRQAERIVEPALESALLPEFAPDEFALVPGDEADAGNQAAELTDGALRSEAAPIFEQSSRPRPPELPSPL